MHIRQLLLPDLQKLTVLLLLTLSSLCLSTPPASTIMRHKICAGKSYCHAYREDPERDPTWHKSFDEGSLPKRAFPNRFLGRFGGSFGGNTRTHLSAENTQAIGAS